MKEEISKIIGNGNNGTFCSTVTSYTGNLTGQVSDLIFVEDNVNNGMVFVRFTSDLFTFTQSRGFQIRYETSKT